MYGIDLLVDEHKNIIVFTEFMRKSCMEIIEGKEPDTKLFREAIFFARNYADKHHHGKEEKILFKVMLEKLGPVAEKLVRNGMYVEHDLGRLHMSELEAALDRYDENKSLEAKLDIITHASGYADLLKRHIAKEDSVVYTFADRSLSLEDKEEINKDTKEFEDDTLAKEVSEKCLGWLEQVM